MMFMNEYEIERAVALFTDETPNLQQAALTLARLMEWTNQNSDGWPYWRKPARAAAKLMVLIHANSCPVIGDVSGHELREAISPIKSFLTRQGVPYAVIQEPTTHDR